MRVGYERVSTRDQHPEAQQDALTAVGCETIYLDRAAGKLTVPRRAVLEPLKFCDDAATSTAIAQPEPG